MTTLRYLLICFLSFRATIGQSVNLATAAPFAVLGAATVTNTGLSVLTGDLGVFPGTAITGFGPGIRSGATHAGDAVASRAQKDARNAYSAAAGLASTSDLTGKNLGGRTLKPGVYHYSSSAFLTGALVLDGRSNANSVFIFQIGSTLITAPGASVSLINGAQACNVLWQVGSSATLDTTTKFIGNIIASASITVNTGATNSGGLYALTGQVSLQSNKIKAQKRCTLSPKL